MPQKKTLVLSAALTYIFTEKSPLSSQLECNPEKSLKPFLLNLITHPVLLLLLLLSSRSTSKASNNLRPLTISAL